MRKQMGKHMQVMHLFDFKSSIALVNIEIM